MKGGSSDNERLPATVPAQCIGQACPYFRDTPCAVSEMEWRLASASDRGGKNGEPPLAEGAKYIVYGLHCAADPKSRLVAQRMDILVDPATVPFREIEGMTGGHGTMPVEILFPALGNVAAAEGAPPGVPSEG